MSDHHLEHEPIHLRSQGIGAFLFDGVFMAITRNGGRRRFVTDGHPLFLHALEQRTCTSAKRLISSANSRLETPALPCGELAAAVVNCVPVTSAGSMSGELDAGKIDVERLGQGLDGERFGDAGHTLQQHVATNRPMTSRSIR